MWSLNILSALHCFTYSILFSVILLWIIAHFAPDYRHYWYVAGPVWRKLAIYGISVVIYVSSVYKTLLSSVNSLKASKSQSQYDISAA